AALTVAWNDAEKRDPHSPMNWPPKKKWANIAVISIISFLIPLASSMVAPAAETIMADFQLNSTTFPSFVVSIFVLGFACGPLLLAPLSETFGRVVVYHATNVFFVIFTIVCALSRNKAMLLSFRFLSGFAGVATITIGPATIADIMSREKRGRAVSIWAVGTVVGPMVGPIYGGYVTQVLGWRWIFWIISIVFGCLTIIACGVLRESYAPVLAKRKIAQARKETRNRNYISTAASKPEIKSLFVRSILRPIKMLVFCPIVTLMCLYIAMIYALNYLFFATFSIIFRESYGFSTFESGLVFIAIGIGTLFGLLYLGCFSDRALKKSTNTGKAAVPEDRLPLLITLPGALTFPLGIFIYGWGVEYHMHWAVPQLGTAFTGFGYILLFTGIQTYLIDAFEEYAASVNCANAVLRGLAGALVPLSGLDLYNALGLGWGNSLLAFVALAFTPLLWIFSVYGARIRASKFIKYEI
ncbi:cycloheximide resistance protein, partial [Periconia macrospinosa]